MPLWVLDEKSGRGGRARIWCSQQPDDEAAAALLAAGAAFFVGCAGAARKGPTRNEEERCSHAPAVCVAGELLSCAVPAVEAE